MKGMNEKRKGYILLAISIISEVIATAMLKVSDGFTVWLPSILVVIGYILSFYVFSLSLKFIPLSLGYAIWSGLGTAFTTFIGIIIWDELINLLSIIGIILIIGGVISLNSGDSKSVKELKH